MSGVLEEGFHYGVEIGKREAGDNEDPSFVDIGVWSLFSIDIAGHVVKLDGA